MTYGTLTKFTSTLLIAATSIGLTASGIAAAESAARAFQIAQAQPQPQLTPEERARRERARRTGEGDGKRGPRNGEGRPGGKPGANRANTPATPPPRTAVPPPVRPVAPPRAAVPARPTAPPRTAAPVQSAQPPRAAPAIQSAQPPRGGGLNATGRSGGPRSADRIRGADDRNDRNRGGGVRDGRFDRRFVGPDRRPRGDWRRRDRVQPEIVRRSDTILVQRRGFRGRDGRVRYAGSRRYWVRDRRYGNRFDRRGRSIYWLPPVVAGVAALGAGAYYLSSSRASRDDYVTTFMAPPLRRFDRRYTLDEVIYDPEIRSAMRSVELDLIKFPSGSDEIPEDQLNKLEDVAEAILTTLKRRPGERFLIEGHTDSIGQDDDNLDLSQRRAAAVQEALIQEFGIPAESLESVGYGEQYLLIDTDQSEPRNRRVVVRAIGALLADRR